MQELTLCVEFVVKASYKRQAELATIYAKGCNRIIMQNLVSSATEAIELMQISVSHKARMLCELAKELESAGDYEAACSVLGEKWQGVGARPSLDGLDESVVPHVLLRAGTLTGWIGSSKQLAGAQESAKNLISESVRLFGLYGTEKNVIEAQAELALCYWREGSAEEASIILRDAGATLDAILGKQSELSPADVELRATLLLRIAIAEFGSKQFEETLKVLTEAVPLAENTQNNILKGKLHNEIALTLRNLSESEDNSQERREELIDRALIEYAAASYYFEEASHFRYSARVENNLGMLCLTLRRHEQAHEHLGRAHALFIGLRDEGSRAQVDEALARLFLAEGRTSEAERSARAAVSVLAQGGETALFVEALITHGVSLARTERATEAREVFERAVEQSELAGDREGHGRAMLALIEEIGERLTLSELCRMYEQTDQLLLNAAQDEMRQRLVIFIKRLTAKMQETILLERPNELSQVGEVSDERRIAKDAAKDSFAREDQDKSQALSLAERVHIYEGGLIKAALEQGNNSVNRAAELLGVSHQTLSRILHHRHSSLLSLKKPRKRRQVNLIQHPKKSRPRDA